MRYIKAMDIKPDMILARSLFNKNGDIFLEQNARLSTGIIQHLKEAHYRGACIYDDFSSKITIKENLPIDCMISAIQGTREINIDECRFISGKVVKLLEAADTICSYIRSLASYDSYTYVHSINVATYAGTFGMMNGFDANKVKNLTLAGLLHDIGKTMVPEQIIKKSDKLTDEERVEVQKHPEYGYTMLKDLFSIPSVVRVSVLQHHENYDGTGYGRKLRDKDTYVFSKIIHICDVYDAMISKRRYKNPINPVEVIKYLISEKGRMFNGGLVDSFLKCITPYPDGLPVRLSDNRTAVVAKQNAGFPAEPVVKTISGEMLDLSRQDEITIKCIC